MSRRRTKLGSPPPQANWFRLMNVPQYNWWQVKIFIRLATLPAVSILTGATLNVSPSNFNVSLPVAQSQIFSVAPVRPSGEQVKNCKTFVVSVTTCQYQHSRTSVPFGVNSNPGPTIVTPEIFRIAFGCLVSQNCTVLSNPPEINSLVLRGWKLAHVTVCVCPLIEFLSSLWETKIGEIGIRQIKVRLFYYDADNTRSCRLLSSSYRLIRLLSPNVTNLLFLG